MDTIGLGRADLLPKPILVGENSKARSDRVKAVVPDFSMQGRGVNAMLNLKRKAFAISLLAICILACGCAGIQRTKKAEDFEKEISRLMQLIEEKDEILNQLHKQFQERELSNKKERERLYKELNELRTRLKVLKKEQPAFK